MSEKHRNLPVWMVKSNDESSKGKDAEKKKTHEATKRRAKKSFKSVVTYWMNERELVETALDILKDKTTLAGDAVQMVIPDSDSDADSDVQDRTDISDIAELQTLPYGHCVEESRSINLDCRFKPPLHASGAAGKPDVDDEALELVREIFFT